MTLLEVAKENQDLLNDGILTLLLYKKGRSWQYKELYCCEFTEGVGYEWNFDDIEEIQVLMNIMKIDKNAIIINGYDSAYCQGSIKKICDGLRYAYNNHWGLLEYDKEYIQKEIKNFIPLEEISKTEPVEEILKTEPVEENINPEPKEKSVKRSLNMARNFKVNGVLYAVVDNENYNKECLYNQCCSKYYAMCLVDDGYSKAWVKTSVYGNTIKEVQEKCNDREYINQWIDTYINKRGDLND